MIPIRPSVFAELMRLLTKKHDLPWHTAWEITQGCTGYTNHTILSVRLNNWIRTS